MGVISFLFAVSIIFPSITEFIRNNIFIDIIIIIFFLFVFLIHFNIWKSNKFCTVKIYMDALLVIEGRNENHLLFEISQLIVPSEDSLMLTLTLEFDDFIKSKLLNNSCYTLIFKKPNDLDVIFKNSNKSQYTTVTDGLDNPFYCISFNYKNNSTDKFLFELQADKNIKGNFEVYFLVGNDFNLKDISSKKSPILKKNICSRDIEIDDDCIVIDKKSE